MLSILTVLCILMTLLAGCGQKEENVPAETDHSEDTLNIGIGSEFSNIVPMSNNVALSNRDGIMIFALYDPLLWFDTETSTIKPWICTDWEVSEDGLEYTLKIRDDVYFHNGSKLTADDVVWTLNLCPENPTVTLANCPGFGHAEKVDDTTVKLIMEKPFVAVPNFLASYHLVMLSKEYFDEVGWEGYQDKPIGTGPYKFAERVIGGSMTLEANENYWGGKPDIQNVKINIIPDPNAQVLALEAGEIDVLMNAPLSNCSKLEQNDDIEVSYRDSFLVCSLTMGMKIILNDNLRKAIAYAINVDEINNQLNLGKTKAVSCGLAPGVTGRPDEGSFTAPIKYDPEEAKRLFEASEYDNSQPLAIVCVAGSRDEQICKVLQGNLQNIGMSVELSAVDGATYMTYLYGGQVDLSVYSALPSLYDANLVAQSYDRNSATWVTVVYPEKDLLADLSEASKYELDPEKRKAMFAEIISIQNENAYQVNLFQDCNTVAFNGRVKDVKAIPGTNYRIAEWSWK